MTVYHITLGAGRTTEELVAAARYGYCHSQVFSDNCSSQTLQRRNTSGDSAAHFRPSRIVGRGHRGGSQAGLGTSLLRRRLVLRFEYPEVQLEGSVAFLHDPWLGNHGRRDALCLWNNKGRRELGLEGFDDSGSRITGWPSCARRESRLGKE